MIKIKTLNEATVSDLADGKVKVTDDAGETVKVTPEENKAIDTAKKVLDEPDVYSGAGIIEKALDRSLVVAKRCQKTESTDYPNLLFIGNAGTGKTGRIKAWAKKNHINLVIVSAATMDDTDLGGALAPDLKAGIARKLASTQFDELGSETDSVLFLDEWNRAAPTVRGTLLTLIQDHTIPDPREKGSQRKLKNFLFTAAAINPADSNYNTFQLDDAELGRVRKIMVEGDKMNTLGYIRHEWGRAISRASDESEKRELEGQLRLAETIISNKDFTFNDQAEIDKSHLDYEDGRGNGLITNPRTFTNLLTYCNGTKEDFINLWEDYCNAVDLPTIKAILANYKDIDDKANDALKNDTDSTVLKTKVNRAEDLKNRLLSKNI